MSKSGSLRLETEFQHDSKRFDGWDENKNAAEGGLGVTFLFTASNSSRSVWANVAGGDLGSAGTQRSLFDCQGGTLILAWKISTRNGWWLIQDLFFQQIISDPVV